MAYERAADGEMAASYNIPNGLPRAIRTEKSKYVRRVLLPVTKSRHMLVCIERVHCTKPGGTAGYTCPSINCRDRFFYLCRIPKLSKFRRKL